jgi:hypothetical protein
MPPGGFELAISASERPQTYALDRAAIRTGFIIRRYYSLYTEIGICQRMTYTNCFVYRVVAPDEACSKHVEVKY